MLENDNKLKVEIYVPLQVCACQWENFINRVFEVITPYIQYIDHQTKSLHSKEAAKRNLFQKCVVIEGERKITSAYALKRQLPMILKEKGILAENELAENELAENELAENKNPIKKN
ncbi:MAG: hypothetical protein BAJALOKI1v1_2330005 [Promethearchaeota archaeon]|nr:MAG: hypothetical protein BAJALOKI1v1_2330005 [Candidatus Lokiarchaeota archaeon]